MNKFGRTYHLEIQTDSDGSTLVVEPPFTVEFDIIRNTLTSANICQIRVYNLSENNRDKIRFNQGNYGDFRSILFQAGYGKQKPPTVFFGNLTQAWSVREGVNMITQIECLDGGFAFANGDTNVSFPAGTEMRSIIRTIMGDLPHIKPGVIGNYEGKTQRGSSYAGNSAEILRQLTGGGFFVDNGIAYALKTGEYLATPGAAPVIDLKSGLLGTPVLEQGLIRFDMLFEPRLSIGQKITIQSATAANFNGDYVLTAIKHRGMISESVCGSAITTGEFLSNAIDGVS